MVNDNNKYETVQQKKKIIIMVPYPAQGHVTPMLKLATTLSSNGYDPLIVLPEFLHRTIVEKVNTTKTKTKGESVKFVSISDGLSNDEPRDFFAIETAMEDHMPAHLDRLIRNISDGCDGGGVACMAVDILASWAINVGKQRGIKVVGFWPAMLATYCLVSSIPHMLQNGLISDSGLPKFQGHISYPCQPPLRSEHLPWLIGNQTTKVARFKFWVRTMDRSKLLKCILVNSFPNEPQTNINSNKWALNPTHGPTIHSIGPLKSDGLFETLPFWEEDESCLNWLDQQKPNSVVYISFGSWVSPIGESKVSNLARSLEELKRPFIWVLGPGWRDGLPKGYMDRVGKFGKIVSWAPQIDVLKHKGVGCYLTHCGWNSTLEAIQCKKMLLCFPVAGDQFLNCEYIVNVWKIGVRMKGFCIDDVSDGINRVIEDWSMKKRMDDLHESVMGDEAISKRKNEIMLFVNDIKSAQLSCN